MKTSRLCLGIGVAGILLVSACGTGTTSQPTVTTTSMSAMPGMDGMPAPSTAPGVPVAANAVSILNFAFAPNAITVAAGTKVTWTNKDEEPHTVVTPGGPVKSTGLGTGATYSYTFNTPGTYQYVCSIHPFMHGTVTVTP